jgi:hypothetical protein
MGFLPPLIAAASAAAASAGPALTAVAAATTAAAGVKALTSGGHKGADLAARPIQATQPLAAPAAPTPPLSVTKPNTNRSLAALAPGLALAGTGGFMSSASKGVGKALLGQ